MQAFYFLSALMLAFGLYLSSVPRAPDPIIKESEAVLRNLAQWHIAASKLCLKTTCVTGLINPTSELPEMVSYNVSALQGSFETRYDDTTRDLVTYLKPNALTKFAGPTSGTVTAALGDVFKTQTFSVGAFDKSSGKIIPNYRIRSGYEKSVPSAIAARIADGSPIIATKM
jgi:hypothetical protein